MHLLFLERTTLPNVKPFPDYVEFWTFIITTWKTFDETLMSLTRAQSMALLRAEKLFGEFYERSQKIKPFVLMEKRVSGESGSEIISHN